MTEETWRTTNDCRLACLRLQSEQGWSRGPSRARPARAVRTAEWQRRWQSKLPALAIAWLLVVCGGAAHAQDSLDNWRPTECGQAFVTGPTHGLRCLKHSLGAVVADYAAHLVEQRGQALFGDNFAFVHRLSWSPFVAGTIRNLDTVIPLQFGHGDSAPETALFFQQGVTRWQDEAGFTRNDVRHGVAYRFALSDDHANILGLSAIYQENIERGHRRLVTTLDYTGRYGTGRLQHFMPASSWKTGRAGYEERAIGGTEIGASLGITPTLSLNTALTRWDDRNEDDRDIHGRVGLGFRPHQWLSLRAGYETGLTGDAAHAHVELTIPLGGVPKQVPRWEGLGALGIAAGASSDIWRPVENVEQLQTLERIISPAVAARAGNIAVRFLQAEAASGSRIGVRVSIPAPLSEDLRLVLRLVPGSGDNPAVPGTDFVDEPQEVTIAQGEISAAARFQLLHNADLQTDRSLAVSVSLGASS